MLSVVVTQERRITVDLLMRIIVRFIDILVNGKPTWKHALVMLLVLFVIALIFGGPDPWYYASCRSGLTPVVKLFLLAGMDPNLPTEPGFCETLHPLAFAIESGNPATCEALIAAGADTRDVAFRYGPIAYAAQVGNVRMVEYFITKENLGDSPVALAQTLSMVLMRGATYGKTEIIDYAIANGADPNYPMHYKGNLAMAAISEAGQSGNTELVATLQRWYQAERDTEATCFQ